MNVTDVSLDESVPNDSRPGVGFPYAASFAAIVMVCLLVAALILNRVGVTHRQAPAAGSPAVVVVEDSKALLAAWKASGLHGIWLVDVTRETEFSLPMATMTPTVVHAWPVRMPDYTSTIEAEVSRENVVRVAALTGIARSVTYILSPGALAETIEKGTSRGLKGVAPDRRSVVANDDGYLRTLVDEMPPTFPSPAVLNIDATYFIDGTPEDLVTRIHVSHAGFRLITLDRASDDPAVTDSARAALERAAEMLRGQETGQ